MHETEENVLKMKQGYLIIYNLPMNSAQTKAELLQKSWPQDYDLERDVQTRHLSPRLLKFSAGYFLQNKRKSQV